MISIFKEVNNHKLWWKYLLIKSGYIGMFVKEDRQESQKTSYEN
jgi:hypothetical protein